jgi:prepilin-type N-terminal cleavage/methylation domain-containing protein
MGRLRKGLGGRRKGRVEGFTLIELMVVIVIIAILMSIAIAVVQGIVSRARTTRTEGLVRMLSEACNLYKQDFDQYPPGQDSVALHQALGSPRIVILSRMQEGNITSRKGPYIEFRAGMLEKGAPSLQPPPPSAIVDAWDNPIHYRSKGQHNKKGVDIWSEGPKKDKQEDDVTNWIEQ